MADTAPIGSHRPPPNVNPSPRMRFQESANNIAAHRELIQRNEFQRACDFTLLHMQYVMAQEPFKDFNTCAANSIKLTGIQEFLTFFRTLAEPPMRQPATVDRDNLKITN